MTLQTIEEKLFERYKYYVERQIKYSKLDYHWETIGELQLLLNELFNYDFPYANGKYYAIKNEEIVYEHIYE